LHISSISSTLMWNLLTGNLDRL